MVDERIAAYIASLEQDKSEIVAKIEKEALADNVPIIKKPAQSLLRFFLHASSPQNILEVGAAVGFSSIFMSDYIQEKSHITTIEKVPKRIAKAKENIRLADREDKISLLEGDAADWLKELVQQKKIYDFIFMDAAKGQYIHFLPYIMELLKIGGILISDNVLQEGDIVESRYGVTRRNRTIHARMREYLYTLTHNPKIDTLVLPVGDGVTVSTRL